MRNLFNRMYLFISFVCLFTSLASGQHNFPREATSSVRRVGVFPERPSRSGPYFTSYEHLYREQVGHVVTLSCQVENLGTSTVIWKHSNRIISAADVVIRKDPRISLHGGYNLRIQDLKEMDSGKYTCEVETYGSPISQVNSLEILVPPRVVPQPSDGNFVVRKGSTITLECIASGNPKPKIVWQKLSNQDTSDYNEDDDNLMSSENSNEREGDSFVIQNVKRQHSGIYMCSADNSVGEPAVAQIDLTVLYAPEIDIKQAWIRTNQGIETEIVCSIYAEPKAEVKWYKDMMLLDETANMIMDQFGNRHTLHLRNVQETDFGNYSCMADNSLGRLRSSVEVSGRPHRARIITSKLGFFKDRYNLTWIVDSFLPIAEYRILYRLNSPNDYKDHSIGRQKHKVSSPIEWTNIIPTMGGENSVPESKFHNSFSYTGTFMFYDLDANTEYEVIIQSRNRQGWSDASDIFRFKTRTKDYNPMDLPIQGNQPHTSSCNTVSLSFLLLSLAFFLP